MKLKFDIQNTKTEPSISKRAVCVWNIIFDICWCCCTRSILVDRKSIEMVNEIFTNSDENNSESKTMYARNTQFCMWPEIWALEFRCKIRESLIIFSFVQNEYIWFILSLFICIIVNCDNNKSEGSNGKSWNKFNDYV